MKHIPEEYNVIYLATALVASFADVGRCFSQRYVGN